MLTLKTHSTSGYQPAKIIAHAPLLVFRQQFSNIVVQISTIFNNQHDENMLTY